MDVRQGTSTDKEWQRKRDLANARMRKYREKKQAAKILAQKELKKDVKRMKKIEAKKAQQRRACSRERSRRYRQKQRIKLKNDLMKSQHPAVTDDKKEKAVVTRAQSSTSCETQIALDHVLENVNHNDKHSEPSQADTSAATDNSQKALNNNLQKVSDSPHDPGQVPTLEETTARNLCNIELEHTSKPVALVIKKELSSEDEDCTLINMTCLTKPEVVIIKQDVESEDEENIQVIIKKEITSEDEEY